MATNNKRRESTRRQLEQQLKQRQEREARRKRATLIGSVVGSIVVIAAIVVVLIVTLGSNDDKKSTAAGASSARTTASSGGACTGSTVSFQGVTVGCATDLTHQPKVSSKGTATPTAVEYKDLVVGKGKAASPSSTVTVQYTGALYKNGTVFDSSWAKAGAKPVSFSLAQVVAGFKEGIGGDAKIPPMKIGGRRIMILPSSLGYGAQASGSIPANSTLVFVVDLTKVA